MESVCMLNVLVEGFTRSVKSVRSRLFGKRTASMFVDIGNTAGSFSASGAW